MTATRLDITIEQGTDYRQDFPVSFPLPLVKAAMQLRGAYGGPTALLTLGTDAGTLTLGTNIVSAKAGWALTEAILSGAYVYDMKGELSDGTVVRIYYGTASVTPEVTTIDFPPVGESGSYILLGVF